MKTQPFGIHACLIIWPALMLGALAASSQSARGLFISRSLNPESCVTVFLLYTKTSEKSKLIIKDPLQHM